MNGSGSRPICRLPEITRYALNYGHPGVMTIPHLAMEEFMQAAAIEIKDIPFQHSAAVLENLRDKYFCVQS